MRSHFWLPTFCAVALLLGEAGPVLASDKDSPPNANRQVVIGDGSESITITSEGSELTIAVTEDGHSRVAVVDLDQVGTLVGESLSGLAAALSEMQLEFKLGKDNSVSFADGQQEWVLDVDEMLAEVGQALEAAFTDLDKGEWKTHRRVHHIQRVDADGGDEVQAEMEALRAELKELKRELARLQTTSRSEEDR